MNKIVVGLAAGMVLGAMDGATALFYPETRPVIGGILAGSTFKGMLVGLFSGWLACKVDSTRWGIVAGAALGLLLAYGVAAMDATNGRQHYLEIMLPGFVTGALIGFWTQRAGTRPKTTQGAPLR
jgi:MFS family permease